MVIGNKITHKHHVLQRFPDGGLYLPPNLKFRIMFRYAHFLSGLLPPASEPPPHKWSFTASAPPDLFRPPDLRRPSERSGAHSSSPFFTPGIVLRFGIRYLLSLTVKGVAPRLYLTSKGRARLCFRRRKLRLTRWPV